MAPHPPPTAPEFDALDAAAELADQLHVDLCEVYAGYPCSCGVPGLVKGLRDWALATGSLGTATEFIRQAEAA